MILSGIFLMVVSLIIFYDRGGDTEYIFDSLPNDVVHLSDGTFVSMSQHYDVGYWKGMNDMLVYLQENNNLRQDTTTKIHLEQFIEMNKNHSQEYFETYKNRK